ncbi:calmodulin-binding-domain-containing protein [Globomyces pollinis-pini]|nr:calmodulin-binding-domain-containing protein [Globomyces pollinis-pini]KAJ2993554.1 hypothetical protein HDV02_002249 [Globomyces sp. JEL0801]
MATTAAPKASCARHLGNTPTKNHNQPKGNNYPHDPLEESVYNLIPEEYIPPPKEKRYRSQYADQARKEYVSDTKKTASMGPAKLPVPAPNGFMKKRNGVPKVEISKGERDRVIRKAPLPEKNSAPIKPCTKNFIEQNALDNINSMAKLGKGKSPMYLTKKDYGRTPDYLQKRIQEIEQAELQMANHLALQQESKARDDLEDQGIVVLPDEERSRILQGLQANWEKLNKDYQKLSLTVDTVPKIARKVNMEQQLKQYEELIDRFSHTNIHVRFNSVYE